MAVKTVKKSMTAKPTVKADGGQSENDEYLDKTYGKQGTNLFGDFGRNWDNIGNGIVGGLHGLGELSSGFSDYTGLGKGGITGLLLGLKPRSTSTGDSGQYDETPGGRKGGRATPNTSNASRSAQQQAEEAGMSFADYLQMANEMGLGGTPDYAGMKKYLQDNAASADSRLDAMYRQLRGSIDADAPGIGQNYDAAVSGQNQNAQQAQAVTNQGYDAARAAQTKQLQELGIGEAAGTLAANGGFAAGDQGAANANIEQNRLAATQQGTANKASALNYNTGISNAAGLEGNVQRAVVQQQLAESLAKLQMQEQQDAVSGNQSRFQTALQLKSMDDSAGAGQAKAAQQDFENQLAVAKLKLDEAKAGGSQKTLADALTNYAQLQQIAQQAGVGNDADSYKAFLENLGLASKLG